MKPNLRKGYIDIQGFRFISLPLIAAVPHIECAGPPLTARCAPGSLEFLNCCPFKAGFAEETGMAGRFEVVLGTAERTVKLFDAEFGTLEAGPIWGPFAVTVFVGRR